MTIYRGETQVSYITFEEIISTIVAATLNTFKTYMDLELIAGSVEKLIAPIQSDVTGIVAVAGDRIGYIILSTDRASARFIATGLLMAEDADEECIRDAVGEMTNNIAGAFKTRFDEQYGKKAPGLPLIISGKLSAVSDSRKESSLDVKFKGVTIPFQSADGKVFIKVMVYM